MFGLNTRETRISSDRLIPAPAPDARRGSRGRQRGLRAPVNRVWRWSNPDLDNSGSMAAITPPLVVSGQTCRSFRETITLKDGRSNTIAGRACQKADGSWDITA
jgi:surface antigen